MVQKERTTRVKGGKMTELSLKDKLSKYEKVTKTVDVKLPARAKVRRGKMKKGWIGILKIEENGNTSMEKQKVEDFVFRTKDGVYHATDGREIGMWNGKHPYVIQQSWKLNPMPIKAKEDEKNETYGQKYVMARMLKDAIVKKVAGAKIIIWILVLGAIAVGVSYFLKKGGV